MTKYETLRIRYTRGDHATEPGGIILRKVTRGEDVEFVAHNFNRNRGSKEPREFYWGHYADSELAGLSSFSEKVSRAAGYDRGGALIPDRWLDQELKKEIEHDSASR
jgi:hypothetical protein